MAGRIFEDRFDAECEEDGTVLMSVEQPVNERRPAYIWVEGSAALSVAEAENLVDRLQLTIRAARRHQTSREQVAW